MTLLRDLLLSGWFTALAAVVLLVETAFLLRAGSMARGLVLPNAAAGLCLIGSLHAALAGWHWLTIAGFLSAALVAHLADLRARLRARNPAG